MRSAPTLKIWMTPLASVAMLEKLALLKIASCKAPVLSNVSWRRISITPSWARVLSPAPPSDPLFGIRPSRRTMVYRPAARATTCATQLPVRLTDCRCGQLSDAGCSVASRRSSTTMRLWVANICAPANIWGWNRRLLRSSVVIGSSFTIPYDAALGGYDDVAASPLATTVSPAIERLDRLAKAMSLCAISNRQEYARG